MKKTFFGRRRTRKYQTDLPIRILSEVSKAVGSSLKGPDETHHLITEAVIGLLGAERSVLFLPKDGQLYAGAFSGLFDAKQMANLRIPLEQGVLGHVFQTGKAILIEDIAKTEFSLTPAIRELGIRSIIAAPLKMENTVIGVIVADTPRSDDHFDRSDLQLLEVFGGIAALLTAKANLISELQAKNQSLESIFTIIRGLSNESSTSVILQKLLHVAIEQTQSSSGSIIFVDPKQQQLIIRASEGLPENIGQNLRLKIGEGVTGWVARVGQTAMINDVRHDKRYVAAEVNVRSELAVPIKMGQDIFGVLNVDSAQLNAYTAEDQTYLEALADIAAARLKIAFLKETTPGSL